MGEQSQDGATVVRAGRFGYRRDPETVWWSRQTAALHGYPPGDPAHPGQAGVEVLLGHGHAPDRPLLAAALSGERRFCLRLWVESPGRCRRMVSVDSTQPPAAP